MDREILQRGCARIDVRTFIKLCVMLLKCAEASCRIMTKAFWGHIELCKWDNHMFISIAETLQIENSKKIPRGWMCIIFVISRLERVYNAKCCIHQSRASVNSNAKTHTCKCSSILHTNPSIKLCVVRISTRSASIYIKFSRVCRILYTYISGI